MLGNKSKIAMQIIVCLTLFALVTLVGCEKPINKTDPTTSLNSAESLTDSRGGENEVLTIPGDPTSVFDPILYEHSSDPDPALSIKEDFIRGGLLYDTWWTFNDGTVGTPPTETETTHPAWPTAQNPNQTSAATWVCNECHGWDYLGVDGVYGDTASIHFSGIKGLIAIPNGNTTVLTDPALIYDFIHSGITATNASHEFGLLLEDTDIYALTRFISNTQAQSNDVSGQFSPYKIIDPVTKSVTGDQAAGYLGYHADVGVGGCDGTCHGKRGGLIGLGTAGTDNLKTRTLANPWKALHNIRFGLPGSQPFMTGITSFVIESEEFNTAANILAYSQGGLMRSHHLGGRVYDNWMRETLQPSPIEFNPLWDQRDIDFDAPPTVELSWTCSGCHDWDFSGYIGFENDLHFISEVADWSPNVLFSALKVGFNVRQWPNNVVIRVHDYGQYLKDSDVWNLVALLTGSLINPYKYVSSVYSSRGDYALGKEIFYGASGVGGDCITCHGIDGMGGGIAENPTNDIFALAWDSPFEFFHKVRFGAAGSKMKALVGQLNASGASFTFDDITNVHGYAQLRLDPSTPP